MRFWAGTLAAACSVLAFWFALATVAEAEALPPDFYGVNAQAVFDQSQDQWGPQLDAMRAAGLSVVRRDASWSVAEPDPPDPATGAHTYHWDRFDAQVTALAQHGLRWYPIIDYSAPWASSIPGTVLAPPAHDSDYVAYARALAERYGRGGAFWREHPELPQLPVTAYEVWNEPNFARFWQPQTGAADRYADLYLETRAALHQVDPQARAVIGGLVDWDGQSFLREMYRHRPDLRRNADAVGYHPYHLTAARVEDSIRQLRDALDSLGQPHVPIEVTEVGLLAPDPSTEALRAQLLSKLATDLPHSGLGVTRLIPHTWLSGASTEPWGIYNADATPRPSGAAYAQAILRESSTAATKPAVRALLRRGRATVGRHGRARLRVACRGEGGVCRGTVRIEMPGAQAAGIGRSRFTVAAGRTAVVQVPLTSHQRELLRRRLRLRVRAYAAPVGAAGSARRVTLVLRRARRG